MKRVMISQPMNGKTDSEILEIRNETIINLRNRGYETVNSFFADEWTDAEELAKQEVRQIPVHFLAKSLTVMSFCDAVYFCKGWDKARGCRIEHDVASAYGLELIYEED